MPAWLQPQALVASAGLGMMQAFRLINHLSTVSAAQADGMCDTR